MTDLKQHSKGTMEMESFNYTVTLDMIQTMLEAQKKNEAFEYDGFVFENADIYRIQHLPACTVNGKQGYLVEFAATLGMEGSVKEIDRLRQFVSEIAEDESFDYPTDNNAAMEDYGTLIQDWKKKAQLLLKEMM